MLGAALGLDRAHLLLLAAFDLTCWAKMAKRALVSPTTSVNLLEVVSTWLALVADVGRLHLGVFGLPRGGLDHARSGAPALDLLLG